MPKLNDKTKPTFFLRQKSKGEDDSQYVFTELSRLLIDINARFARINNQISSLDGNGGGETDEELEARVAALEAASIALASQVQALTASVASVLQLMEADDDDADIEALQAAVAELTEEMEFVKSSLYFQPFEEQVVLDTPFLAYTAQEFEFPVDADSISNVTKMFASIVTEGVLPQEIVFANINYDITNQVVRVRYINNTPTDVLWPKSTVLLQLLI